MPGTIQVSVLDLVDFPSSSSPSSSSSIFIKVSMGKIEYQTFDKGDFSFPLINLRDNLIITLLNADGKELSRTGVQTMLIVEKGTLDDFFAFEGGPRLHLKLQFTLSDIERKRIQELRETALKKKHKELLSGSLRYIEAASFGDEVGSSSRSLNREVTDSPEGLVQMEIARELEEPVQELSVSNKDNSMIGPIYDSRNGDKLLQDRTKQLLSTETDRGEGTSSRVHLSEDPIAQHSESGEGTLDKIETRVPSIDIPIKLTSSLRDNKRTFDKIETRVSPFDIPRKPTSSVEANERTIDKIETPVPPIDVSRKPTSCLESLDPQTRNLSVLDTVGEDQVLNKNESRLPPNDVPMRRISSVGALDPHSRTRSVSRTLEENRSLDKFEIQLAPTVTPMRRISSLKALDPHSQHRPVLVTSNENKTKNNSSLKKTPSNVRKMISAFESSQTQGLVPRVDPPTLRTQPNKIKGFSEGSDLKVVKMEKNQIQQIGKPESSLLSMGMHREVTIEKNEDCQLAETSLYSKEKDQEMNLQQNPNNIRDQRDITSQQKIGKNRHEHGTSSDKLTRPVNYRRSSSKQQQTEEYSRLDECSSGNSCILLDESRRLCITTGSKQMMDLMGGCDVFQETDRRETSFSKTEATNEDEACSEVNRHAKGSSNLTKREMEEGSVDIKVPGGLVRQAVRVAVMVAFGTFVLVTRQRQD